MTCIKPIIAWHKKLSSLTEDSITYYKNKKLRFKKPKNINDYYEVKIPCGHCLGCRLDHANQWATRIMLEAQRHEKNCFVTLTYNNEKLPKSTTGHMTLRKKDLQDFIKRLREKLETKILYFACGEYGDTTYRPHYHMIIFGWEPDDIKEIIASKTKNAMFTSKMLEQTWQNGYVAIEELNYKTACYTARYVQKKAGVKPNRRFATQEIDFQEKIDERNKKPFIMIRNHYKTEKYDYLGREKEFLVMSKKPAIGLTYWNENKDKIIKNESILINVDHQVQTKPIPRYFKKLWLKSDKWDMVIKNGIIADRVIKYQKDKLLNITGDNKEKILLETQEKNLENRARFLKREQN